MQTRLFFKHGVERDGAAEPWDNANLLFQIRMGEKLIETDRFDIEFHPFRG
jgi:hypothetical protein